MCIQIITPLVITLSLLVAPFRLCLEKKEKFQVHDTVRPLFFPHSRGYRERIDRLLRTMT